MKKRRGDNNTKKICFYVKSRKKVDTKKRERKRSFVLEKVTERGQKERSRKRERRR